MQAIIGAILVIGISVGSFCGLMNVEQATAINVRSILVSIHGGGK